MPETAEAIFRATETELREQAAVVTGTEPVVAAGAFWPNGVTRETMDDGTVGGHKLGAVLGPNLGAMVALAGAFAGRGGDDPTRFDLAKPLIVAVTATHIHIIEPADDDAADSHFRLHASVAPYMARSGPEKAVLAELAPRA